MAASEIMKTEFNLFTKYDVIVELLIGQWRIAGTERADTRHPPKCGACGFAFDTFFYNNKKTGSSRALIFFV